LFRCEKQASPVLRTGRRSLRHSLPSPFGSIV